MTRARRDDGSTLPLVLLCFMVALFLVAGTVAASSAFLAQRDLQADCDGAAVAGAAAVDPGAVYAGPDPAAGGGERGPSTRDLPLATDAAQAAVEEYAARAGMAGTSFAVAVSDDTVEVAVTCVRTVTVPFAALFGLSEGLVRTTASSARSPVHS